MIELPKENYVQKDGKTHTTMRQQVLHCVGLIDGCSSRHKPYTRHGRKFYKPWRNHFDCPNKSPVWEPLVAEGIAESREYSNSVCSGVCYWLTRKGFDWLGEQLGIVIHDEEE